MAAPQPGVTLTFQLVLGQSTQLSVGLEGRVAFVITNNDTVNSVAVGFGTGNNATSAMHVISPGGVMMFGEITSTLGGAPGVGHRVLRHDIAATPVTGNPQIAFTEW